MTRYAASSIAAFKPGDGCPGHTLADPPADPDYPFLSVDCPVCDPILARDPHWAGSAAERPLTAPELKQMDALKLEVEERRQKAEEATQRAMIALAERFEREDAEKAAAAAKAAAKPAPRKPSGTTA